MSSKEEKYPVKWYRSSLYCATLVAWTAFTCPGIWSALNGMGAGGGTNADISNAANAIIFGVIAIGSMFAGGIINRISPKWGLLIGTLGYTPYAAGLYCSDRFGQTWLLIFGAVVLGISASFLWVASGAVFLGYTEENRKGTATSLKFAFSTLGSSIGGIISLALNVHSNYRGGVSQVTYIVLMTLMCLGFPAALLLPFAHQVQRTDGRPVVLHQQPSIFKEFKVLKGILSRPVIWAVMPLIIYAQWFLSYQWQFNYAYFTVRTRALNSTLFYLLGFCSTLIMGQILDNTRWKRPTRAKIGFFLILVTTGTSWILGQAVQAHYTKTKPTIDWADSSYGLGGFVFCLWGFSDPLVTTYKWWLIGSFSNDVNESAFLAALINGLGSVGSTFGFVVSQQKFSYDGACALNLAIFFLSLPSLSWVVFTQVKETTHGTHLSGDENFKNTRPAIDHENTSESGTIGEENTVSIAALEKNT